MRGLQLWIVDFGLGTGGGREPRGSGGRKLNHGGTEGTEDS